jgi:hypothetical protein
VGKLRKIGKWFWLNKERMLLAVLVIVLGVRVYGVVNPPPLEKPAFHPAPRAELPEDWEDAPPLPRQGPALERVDPATLRAANPFTVVGGGAQNDRREVTPASLGVRLDSVREMRGDYVAYISVGGGRARMTRAGDEFGDGQFRLESVDGSGQSATFWSQEAGRTFTVTVGE